MTQQAPYQPEAHVSLTDLLLSYKKMLTGDNLPERVAVQTADLRELIEAAHPYRLTVAREQTYAHASHIAETYINGEYEAQGRAAQMIFDELRLLAKPKPSASFGIYLAKIIDEMAVDNFTLRMKEKLAKKRTEGRSGWMDMSADDLSVMLRLHVDKGDPVDVANFCMFLSAHDQNIAPDTKTVNGTMTPEEIRIENLKQMAKYEGQIISFECHDPYYLTSCDHCSWVGSSEVCGSDSFGDDSDVYCPRCHSSGADCGKVAERLSAKPVNVAAVREAVEQLIRNRFDTYTAKNGKRVAIEGDDGEKCWIVSFEDMSDLENAIRALSPAEPAPDTELPWRMSDIKRGLILFRTSNNAHGLTNFSMLTERVNNLPATAKTELANMMRNIAHGLHPAEPAQGARPLEEWHEDHGNVVWWAWDNDKKEWFGEPAYIGKPLDSDWPEYHTHWTLHPVPLQLKH